jgi:glutathione synthase/RimK-type ligase-like ATP-grasp enzyme
MHIAYAVPAQLEETLGTLGLEELELLRSTFGSRQVELAPIAWSDPQVDWSQFDAVLPKACWDYTAAPDAFRTWICAIEDTGPPLINRPGSIRWNMDKAYLAELARALPGRVPETVFVPTGESVDLRAIAKDRGWERFIVKPSISAGSRDTIVADRVNAAIAPGFTDPLEKAQAVATGILQRCGLLLQPFLPGIAGGEVSLFFFQGRFSHAVRKSPRGDDFRSQPQFGASIAAYDPPDDVLEQAHAVLAQGPATVYARVDAILEPSFQLMELELIEPYLFLRQGGDRAAQAFAKAVIEELARPQS